MGCGESKSDAVADASDVRLQEAGTAMGAESEREPGAACDVSASPPEGAQAENAWTARAFASSLGVAGAVAEALLDGAAVPAGGEFEFMQSLAGRPDDIEAKLRKGRLVERVAKMLSKGAEEKLKTAEAKTGAELNDKFATDAFKGEMGFGGTAEYYRGLNGLIGSPRFLDGSLRKSVQNEHCGKKDALLPFNSSNGIIGTTSAREWEFVYKPDTTAGPDVYSERGGDFRERNPEWCRKPTALAVFEEKMRLKNEELERAGQTPLILEELIAGRLYTGPMYEKYNAVLRFFAVKNKDGSVRIEYASEADVPFLQKKCGLLNLGTWKPVEGGVRWQWDNTYTTTIHAINSVIVKMSRLSKIKPLYRGWTDATLPKSFFEADGMGVKGGVEYGFSSTTTDRAQAAHYAQGKASTILELEMGMVDRGADIDWLSQYPHEKETLLPPLMGLQVRGTSVDGRTLVVDCRISINMASQTLEQVAGKRKMLLGDMGEQMADEARVGLAEKGLAEELVDGAAGMVRTKLAPMLSEDAQAFNRDVFFQKKVDEALKAKRSVELGAMLASEAGAEGEGGLEAAIERVEPLQANVVDLSEMALGEGGADVAVVVAWMHSNPSGLTRLKIDVPKASAEVVAALHALVAQTATLVDLDAMEETYYERAATLNVLQLNGTEKVKSMDLSNKKLGPVSAAIIGACVRVNPILESLNLGSNNLTNYGKDMTGLLKLVEILPQTKIESLDLAGNQLCGLDIDGRGTYTAEGITKLCEGLKGSSVASLELNENWLGLKGGAALAEGLKGNSTLTALSLNENRLGPEGGAALAEGIKGNSTLTSLSLEKNYIGDKGVTKLAAVLKETKISELNLADNALCGVKYGKGTYTVEGITKLCEGLKGSAVTSLNLYDNQIGKQGAIALAEGLSGNSTLQSLNVDGHPLQIDELKGTKPTEKVDLSGKGLGVKSAIIIASCIKENGVLKELDLAANSIGVKGVTKLAKGLKGNSTLQSLDLASNQLCGLYMYAGRLVGTYTAEGITKLCEGLKGSSVTSLNLAGNGIGVEGASKLAAVLKETKIEKLDVDGHALPIDELKGTKPTEKIDLSNNGLGVASAIIIASCIKENGVLKELNLTANELCGINPWTGEGTYTAEGITKLCEGLKGSAVTSLKLSNNHLCLDENYGFTAEGITKLCEGLKGSAVTSLDLRANGLNDQAKQAVKDAAGSGVQIQF